MGNMAEVPFDKVADRGARCLDDVVDTTVYVVSLVDVSGTVVNCLDDANHEMVPVERPKTNEKFASREKILKWKTGFKADFQSSHEAPRRVHA
jgi:hypothetical protein